MTLKRQVTHGLFWVGLSTAGTRLLSLLVSLVLARILTPAHFRLVAIAWLAIDSLQLFRELGLSAALIYRKDRIREAADTTFVVVVTFSTILYLIAVAGSPELASEPANSRPMSLLSSSSTAEPESPPAEISTSGFAITI